MSGIHTQFKTSDRFDPSSLGTYIHAPGARRLYPWLYRKHQESGLDVPDAVQQEFKQSYRACLRANILLHHALQALLKLLDDAKIPAIPLKGPDLALRLYGDLGVRPSADLDILVRPDDLNRAKALIEASGYKDSTQNPALFHWTFSRQNGNNQTVHLELHRDLIGHAFDGGYFPFGLKSAGGLTGAIWQNAGVVETDLGHYWRMAPADEALYLCLHLAKHLINDENIQLHNATYLPHELLLSLDLHLLLTEQESNIDWPAFEQRMDQFCLRRPVALALTAVSQWFGTSLPCVLRSDVSRRQQSQYVKQLRRNGRLSIRRLPPRASVFLKSYLLADCWRDRAFLVTITQRSIRRRIQDSPPFAGRRETQLRRSQSLSDVDPVIEDADCIDNSPARWPRITVVTPSLNQGRYLEETISSVLSQGYPNLEYIIIDGGSTDNSLEILRRYESEITFWVSEEDAGQAAAINKGFDMATGDLLGWLNSDDVLLDGSLFCLAKGHQNAPDAILLGNGYVFNEMQDRSEEIRAGNVDHASYSMSSLQSNTRWLQPGTYFPRSLYEQIGPFDESYRYVFDQDWLCRALQSAPVFYVQQPIARFRLHPASKTVAEAADWHPELERVNRTHWPPQILEQKRLTAALLEMIRAGYFLRDYQLERTRALRHLTRAFFLAPSIARYLRYWIHWGRLILPNTAVHFFRRVWRQIL